MKTKLFSFQHISRRLFLRHFLGATSVFALSGDVFSQALASSHKVKPVPMWEKEMKKILAGQKTTQARVSIKLPDKASVGTRIPFTASVDLPITQESYITTLHVLGTKSPKALIAQFNLTALSGKAEISGTLHLNEPQDIIAIARTNDNQFFTGRRQVQFDL